MANRNEVFDRDIMYELGELGLLGATIDGECLLVLCVFGPVHSVAILAGTGGFVPIKIFGPKIGTI